MSKIHRILCCDGTILNYSPIIADHSRNLENTLIVPCYLGLTVLYILVKSDDSANGDKIENLQTQ